VPLVPERYSDTNSVTSGSDEFSRHYQALLQAADPVATARSMRGLFAELLKQFEYLSAIPQAATARSSDATGLLLRFKIGDSRTCHERPATPMVSVRLTILIEIDEFRYRETMLSTATW